MPLSIFWPASAEDPAPRLFVYLARPSPRAFLSLMDPDADPDTIFWTDGKDEAAQRASSPPTPFELVPRNDRASFSKSTTSSSVV